MKITNILIKEVKRQLKREWHDQKWHDFMSHKEVSAIIHALQDNKHDAADLSYIKQKANEFLEFLKGEE